MNLPSWLALDVFIHFAQWSKYLLFWKWKKNASDYFIAHLIALGDVLPPAVPWMSTVVHPAHFVSHIFHVRRHISLWVYWVLTESYPHVINLVNFRPKFPSSLIPSMVKHFLKVLSLSLRHTHTHTQTHRHIQIYIYTQKSTYIHTQIPILMHAYVYSNKIS